MMGLDVSWFYDGKYGQYSPFNGGTMYPQKIVDDKGNFIGYFTSNIYIAGRRESNLINAICENWKTISDNINEMTK